jgi:hypothetical protein
VEVGEDLWKLGLEPLAVVGHVWNAFYAAKINQDRLDLYTPHALFPPT